MKILDRGEIERNIAITKEEYTSDKIQSVGVASSREFSEWLRGDKERFFKWCDLNEAFMVEKFGKWDCQWIGAIRHRIWFLNFKDSLGWKWTFIILTGRNGTVYEMVTDGSEKSWLYCGENPQFQEFMEELLK